MSIREKAREARGKREYVHRVHPMWGPYSIRSIFEAERAEIEAENRSEMMGLSDTELDEREIELGKRARVRLIIAAVCEYKTEQLTWGPDDIEGLMQNDSRDIDALVQAVDDHVGFTPMSREEEARHLKNLNGTYDGSLPTVSPLTADTST